MRYRDNVSFPKRILFTVSLMLSITALVRQTMGRIYYGKVYARLVVDVQ